MSAFLRLYRGELPLETAFWTWAVIIGLIVNISSTVLFLVLIMADQPLWAFIAGYGYSIPYNVIATIGVMRSARHEKDNPLFARIAPIVTLAGMAVLTIT